jgi:hypothetical protein
MKFEAREPGLHSAEQDELRAAVASAGVDEVARGLGISVTATMRAAAGMGLRNGTRVVARANWARLTEMKGSSK